jgi:hypothetical protein
VPPPSPGEMTCAYAALALWRGGAGRALRVLVVVGYGLLAALYASRDGPTHRHRQANSIISPSSNGHFLALGQGLSGLDLDMIA